MESNGTSQGTKNVLVPDNDGVPDNRFLAFLYREANFFRIHLFYFTVVPLISSGIFYGANGQALDMVLIR